MFYHALKKLFDDDRYDFLKLTYYLDKHYMSPKSTIDNSIFLFLVPCKDGSLDFAIIVVDIFNGRFVVYDPEKDSKEKDYRKDVYMLKTFLAHYFEYFPLVDDDKEESEYEEEEE